MIDKGYSEVIKVWQTANHNEELLIFAHLIYAWCVIHLISFNLYNHPPTEMLLFPNVEMEICRGHVTC